MQLVKKVLDYPVLDSYKDFIRVTPLEGYILVKLIYPREHCLLYLMKAFEEDKQYILKLKSSFCNKTIKFSRKMDH